MTELTPKPSRRVRSWLDKNAVIDWQDGRRRITYPARDDLIPPDVRQWIDAWISGTPLKT